MCDSHENDKTDVEIRWRRLADKVFKSSTRVDKTQADMSFELMRKDFEAMRELLSNDEDGKESIPDWEVEQVKFWVQSAVSSMVVSAKWSTRNSFAAWRTGIAYRTCSCSRTC